MKHGIEERLHRHHNHTNENLKADKSEVKSKDTIDLNVSNGTEIHCSIGLKSFTQYGQLMSRPETRNTLPDGDNENINTLDDVMVNNNFITYADSAEDTYETFVDTSFKISSTEDNYLKNKLISNDPQAETGDDRYNEGSQKSDSSRHADTSIHEPIIRSKQSDQNNLGSEVGSHGHQGRERLFKHREMIAKLKRKFFESPPKSINKLDVNSNKDDYSGALKGADGTIQKEVAENLKSNNKPEYENKENSNSMDTKRSVKRRFATESRASRLRNSEKSSQGRHRRHSLDGKLTKPEPEVDQVSDLKEQTRQWTDYVAVVAIDFGTSQSGYAYSFLHDTGRYISTLGSFLGSVKDTLI